MLFSNVNEIKTILPIGVGNDFNRLKPHIENVENRYIKPLLGFDMYEALVQLYGKEESQGPSDETPEAEEAYSNEMLRRDLLYKIQFATIHLAIFTGFDFLTGNNGPDGVSDCTTGEKRSRSQLWPGI